MNCPPQFIESTPFERVSSQPALMAGSGRSQSQAQAALDAFVTTQLLDNGLDALAPRINKLRERLLRLQAQGAGPGSSSSSSSSSDAEAKRALARRLQLALAAACRLLARQRAQIQEAIYALEVEARDGVIGARDRGEPPTDAYRRTYARPAGKTAASVASSAAAHYLTPLPEDVLPGDCLVSAKVARSHELWILARVVRFDAPSNTYEVEDVDSGDDEQAAGGGDGLSRRRHVVPWNQVVELPAGKLRDGEWIQYALDERVMAMYPNTTSFYRCTVRVPNPRVRMRGCAEC